MVGTYVVVALFVPNDKEPFTVTDDKLIQERELVVIVDDATIDDVTIVEKVIAPDTRESTYVLFVKSIPVVGTYDVVALFVPNVIGPVIVIEESLIEDMVLARKVERAINNESTVCSRLIIEEAFNI